ncbi:MAG: Mu transposase C-terminal domain-containing protein [Magnetococcales bacterium]|nr:Mu transposase C-terminal domain-containing protein [Magnetococcales bacterium]
MSWFPSKALVGLPGLPGTVRNIQERAEREGWKRKMEKGAWLFHVDSLPDETRLALGGGETLPVAAQVPARRSSSGVEGLKDWQREVMYARLEVVRELEYRATGGSMKGAMEDFVALATDGFLPATLQKTLTTALAKSREGQNETVSVRTLQRWLAAAKKGPANLAPGSMEYGGVPGWAGEFLRRFQSPTQPDVAAVLRGMRREGCKEIPTYSQARHFLKNKVSLIERSRGRISRSKLRSMLPYVQRDFSMLRPGDVVNGDGHSSYCYVLHPETGKPYLPEITEVVDIATRMHLGFSVAVSESTEAVQDALRVAIQAVGTILVLQWDRGSGAKNHAMHDAATGLSSRLGFEVYHPLARNPQAGGVIEHMHKMVSIPAAKRFAGVYIGRRAKNEDLLRDVKKAMQEGKVTPPSLAEFVGVLESLREEYNHRPNRALPKIKDSVTGGRRHQTPAERMQWFVSEGWQPTLLPDAALLDELRPEMIRTVLRGQVSLGNMRYYAPDLVHWHGQQARIRYDIRDGARVWVRAMDGRYICEAKRDGNVRPYLHDNMLEQAHAKRQQARVRLLERKISEIEALEQKAIEGQSVELTEEDHEAAARQLELMDDGVQTIETTREIPTPQPPPAGVRPIFRGPLAERDWGVWVWEHWDEAVVDNEDRVEFEEKLEHQDFRLLIGFDGKKRRAG